MATVATLNALNNPDNLTERLVILGDELARVEPGILLLQEVLHDPAAPGTVMPEFAEFIAHTGYKLAYLGAYVPESSSAIYYDADRYDLLDAGCLHLSVLDERTPDIPYGVFQSVDNGRVIVAFSVHLAWGGGQGHLRGTSVKFLEKRAAEFAEAFPDAVIVAGGDFNEVERGYPMRYLRGETSDEPGAFWVDAWTWLRPDETGNTQLLTLPHAVDTAVSVGIANPELIPDRRIDYLMLRGWVYGRLGPSPAIEFWGTTADGDVSDHLGLALTFD